MGDAPQEAWMVKIERILEEHSQQNTANKIRARQIYIEQRERDRVSRIAKFQQAACKFHCADLFDIETHILDLAKHVRHLVPNLAPLVGQPLLNMTDLELRVDNSRQYEEKQLVPMIGMVWKLARFVDDRIHVQQAAGASFVGYVPFYTYKNYQIFGNKKLVAPKLTGNTGPMTPWTLRRTFSRCGLTKSWFSKQLVESLRGRVLVTLLMIIIFSRCRVPPKPIVTETSLSLTISIGKLRQPSSQQQASRLPLRLRLQL